jgi:DNA-binding transcriptional regulator YhcF (GntR family)
VNSLDVRAIRIDAASATPPFEQVRAHIAGVIASGELPPGTKLPTVRQLAQDIGLAAKTAARVYHELEADGLVATYGRRGTFVRSEITEPGSRSAVAAQAREAAAQFTKRSRKLGLSRSEAVQLVDQSWNES